MPNFSKISLPSHRYPKQRRLRHQFHQNQFQQSKTSKFHNSQITVDQSSNNKEHTKFHNQNPPKSYVISPTALKSGIDSKKLYLAIEPHPILLKVGTNSDGGDGAEMTRIKRNTDAIIDR